MNNHKHHDAQMHILQYDTSVSKVWRGLCPPKAELLVWLLLLGRINTKDRLQRLSVLQNNDLRCVLCNSCDETIAHLFFTCDYTWRVWSFCCNWWGLTWVQSVYPRMNLESWSAVGLRGDQRKAWQVCFYTIIWSIWEIRNKVIFQNANLGEFHDGAYE